MWQLATHFSSEHFLCLIENGVVAVVLLVGGMSTVVVVVSTSNWRSKFSAFSNPMNLPLLSRLYRLNSPPFTKLSDSISVGAVRTFGKETIWVGKTKRKMRMFAAFPPFFIEICLFRLQSPLLAQLCIGLL
jgi:hypothetical protein